MTEEFDYVVAGRWPSGKMKIYTYFSQIQHGTWEQAVAFLSYVKGKKDNEGEEYKIYKINYEEIK